MARLLHWKREVKSARRQVIKNQVKGTVKSECIMSLWALEMSVFGSFGECYRKVFEKYLTDYPEQSTEYTLPLRREDF